MKMNAKILINSNLIIAFAGIAWLSYSLFLYQDIPKLILAENIYNKVLNIGLLFLIICHLIILASIILSKTNSHRITIAGNVLMVIGTTSFVFLFFYLLFLSEIWDDYKSGYPYLGMMKFVWTVVSFHFAFFLYAFVYFLIIKQKEQLNTKNKRVTMKRNFVSMHIIGLVCGIWGVLVAMLFMKMYNEKHYLPRILILPYCFALLPYALAIGVFGIQCFKDYLSWKKEDKLKAVLNNSGVIALLVSITMSIIITLAYFLKSDARFKEYYFSGEIPILWVPFNVFFVLFVFSAIALFKLKNVKEL